MQFSCCFVFQNGPHQLDCILVEDLSPSPVVLQGELVLLLDGAVTWDSNGYVESFGMLRGETSPSYSAQLQGEVDLFQVSLSCRSKKPCWYLPNLNCGFFKACVLYMNTQQDTCISIVWMKPVSDCWINIVLLLKIQDNMRLYFSVTDYDSVVIPNTPKSFPIPLPLPNTPPNPRIYLLEILETGM